MKLKSKNIKTILKVALIVALGLIMILGIAGSNIIPNIASTTQIASNAPVPCGDATKPVPQQYRIYPHLSILVDGSSVTIPSGIGVAPGCYRVIYTNDNSGGIRVEPDAPRAYSLGNFFSVWGQPFSARQILDYKADANHMITMTVNGAPSTDFENLILQDKQQIVIKYDTIVPAPRATSDTNSSSSFTVTIP